MRVLAVNVGSSSIKLDVWDTQAEMRIARLEARGIATEQSEWTDADGALSVTTFPDHAAALAVLLPEIAKQGRVTRIGHRVVHGGAQYRAATWLTEAVVSDLHGLVPLSPLHLPPALAAITACRELMLDIVQAAVFDTAFHATLPESAYTYALPAAWHHLGVRRYGFHGIACADVVSQLGVHLRQRAIILHLGAGCSVTAVREGRSLDTTMGFTPLEGLVMATRSGDVDPGALLYVQRHLGLSAEEMDRALNHESGLLGLSGGTADMRALLQLAERDDPAALLAVEVFCYRAAKAVGALAVALGGVEQLVFSGGIGEHAAPIRHRILALLAWLGVAVDERANGRDAAVITIPTSTVSVHIVHVDEGRAIARQVAALAAP